MVSSTEAGERGGEDPQLRWPPLRLLPHCDWRWAFLCQPADAPAAEVRGARDGTRVGGEDDRPGPGPSEPLPGPCVVGRHASLLAAQWHFPIDSRITPDAASCCFRVPTGSERAGIKVQKSYWDCGGLRQACRGHRWLVQGGIRLCGSGHHHSQTSGGEPQTTCVSSSCRSGSY